MSQTHLVNIAPMMLELLAQCAGLAERSGKDALKGVCVSPDGHKFAATDLEVTLASHDFPWHEDWTLVPAGALLAAFRAIGEGQCDLTWKMGTMEIRSGKTRFSIPLLPKGDFPRPTPKEIRVASPINGRSFCRAIEMVSHAVASSASNFAMCGICYDDGEMVATDGKRLALACVEPVEGEVPKGSPVTIPMRAAQMIVSLFRGAVDPTILELGANEMTLRNEEVSICARLIEGRFPDYRSILPKRFIAATTVAASDLMSCVRRVQIMCEKEAMRLDMSLDTQLASFQATGISGEAGTSMEIGGWDSPMKLVLNPAYLLAAVKGAKSERITISGNDPGRPIIIEAPQYRALIMPLS